MADLEALTPRQRDIYNFIREQDSRTGLWPDSPGDRCPFSDQEPKWCDVPSEGAAEEGTDPSRAEHVAAIQLLEDPVSAHRMGLKLVGRIAAGQPIEAVEHHEELTFSDWTEPGDKFALRVSGESMIDEHIADGDFVIIKRQEQARDGQIVAVRDEDGEATLKKIYRDRNRIRLEPANKTMKPIYRDRVNVLGVLVGVVRKY